MFVDVYGFNNFKLVRVTDRIICKESGPTEVEEIINVEIFTLYNEILGRI